MLSQFWNSLSDTQKINYEAITLVIIIVLSVVVIIIDQLLKERKRQRRDKARVDELESYRYRCPWCHGPTTKTVDTSGGVLRICVRGSYCTNYARI